MHSSSPAMASTFTQKESFENSENDEINSENENENNNCEEENKNSKIIIKQKKRLLQKSKSCYSVTSWNQSDPSDDLKINQSEFLSKSTSTKCPRYVSKHSFSEITLDHCYKSLRSSTTGQLISALTKDRWLIEEDEENESSEKEIKECLKNEFNNNFENEKKDLETCSSSFENKKFIFENKISTRDIGDMSSEEKKRSRGRRKRHRRISLDKDGIPRGRHPLPRKRRKSKPVISNNNSFKSVKNKNNDSNSFQSAIRDANNSFCATPDRFAEDKSNHNIDSNYVSSYSELSTNQNLTASAHNHFFGNPSIPFFIPSSPISLQSIPHLEWSSRKYQRINSSFRSNQFQPLCSLSVPENAPAIDNYINNISPPDLIGFPSANRSSDMAVQSTPSQIISNSLQRFYFQNNNNNYLQSPLDYVQEVFHSNSINKSIHQLKSFSSTKFGTVPKTPNQFSSLSCFPSLLFDCNSFGPQWRQLFGFPPESIFLSAFYLSANDLAKLSAVSKSFYLIVSSHPIWREFVLKDFGFKYENYFHFQQISLNDSISWKLLYNKISHFLSRLRSRGPLSLKYPKLFTRKDFNNKSDYLTAQPLTCHDDTEKQSKDESDKEFQNEQAETDSNNENNFEKINECSAAVSADASMIIFQNQNILLCFKFNSDNLIRTAQKQWETILPLKISDYDSNDINNNDEDISIYASKSSLVLSATHVFVLYTGGLYILQLMDGVICKHLSNPHLPSGRWLATSSEPVLDSSIRNYHLALMHGDILYVWSAIPPNFDFQFSIKPLPAEESAMRQRSDMQRRQERRRHVLQRLRMIQIIEQRQRILRMRMNISDELIDPDDNHSGSPQEENNNNHDQLDNNNRDLLPDEEFLEEELIDDAQTDIHSMHSDFMWSGYRCCSGPNDTECEFCTADQPQGVTCYRKSKYIIVWYRERSPKIFFFDADNGSLIRSLLIADNSSNDHFHKSSRWFEFAGVSVGDQTRGNPICTEEYLSLPTIRRVKQCTNLFDPKHFYLITLDEVGTIRLFDSASNLMPLGVLRTGDSKTFRLMLYPTVLFTMSAREHNTDFFMDDELDQGGLLTGGREVSPVSQNSNESFSPIRRRIPREFERDTDNSGEDRPGNLFVESKFTRDKVVIKIWRFNPPSPSETQKLSKNKSSIPAELAFGGDSESSSSSESEVGRKEESEKSIGYSEWSDLILNENNNSNFNSLENISSNNNNNNIIDNLSINNNSNDECHSLSESDFQSLNISSHSLFINQSSHQRNSLSSSSNTLGCSQPNQVIDKKQNERGRRPSSVQSTDSSKKRAASEQRRCTLLAPSPMSHHYPFPLSPREDLCPIAKEQLEARRKKHGRNLRSLPALSVESSRDFLSHRGNNRKTKGPAVSRQATLLSETTGNGLHDEEFGTVTEKKMKKIKKTLRNRRSRFDSAPPILVRSQASVRSCLRENSRQFEKRKSDSECEGKENVKNENKIIYCRENSLRSRGVVSFVGNDSDDDNKNKNNKNKNNKNFKNNKNKNISDDEKEDLTNPLTGDFESGSLNSRASEDIKNIKNTKIKFYSPQILEFLTEVQVPGPVYFCDVIDNQLLGLWYSAIQRGTEWHDHEWSMSMSHWEVFSTGDDILVSPLNTSLWRSSDSLSLSQMHSNQSRPRASAGGIGKRVFCTKNRLDAWSLLDWKSFSVLSDGTLEVHDFCPESTTLTLALDIEVKKSSADNDVPWTPSGVFTPTTTH